MSAGFWERLGLRIDDSIYERRERNRQQREEDRMVTETARRNVRGELMDMYGQTVYEGDGIDDGERYLLWSGRRGSMTGEGTYRRLSTAKRAAKRLQLKGLDVRITDRLIKESDDMTDREFSEARPCEEGDVMCVDPYPCLVHDRRAAGDDPCSCPSGDGSLRHPCQAHPGDTSDREG